MRQLGSLALCLCSLITAGMVQAASDPSACVRIDDRVARLACYDQAHGRTDTSSGAEGDAGAPAKNASGDAAGAFGAEDVRRQDRGGPDSIEARVVQASRDARGIYTLVLDNEQTWRLTESSQSISFSNGDQVTIRKAAMGSYLLRRAQGGMSFRARRLK